MIPTCEGEKFHRTRFAMKKKKKQKNKKKKKKKTKKKETLAGESGSASRRFTQLYVQPEAAGNSEDKPCHPPFLRGGPVQSAVRHTPKTTGNRKQSPAVIGYKSTPHHHVSYWPTAGGIRRTAAPRFPPGRGERKREETRKQRQETTAQARP